MMLRVRTCSRRLALRYAGIALLLSIAIHGPVCAQDTPTPSQLPRRILSDIRGLATTEPLITLAVGGAIAAASRPSDDRAVRALSGNHTLEESLDAGSTAGNGWMQVGGAAIVYGLGEWGHRPHLASLGAQLLETQTVAGLLTRSFKVAVARARPDGGARSFPSGHASATTATAAVIAARYGWRVGALAYAGATYVAVSRIADRQHFTSDVIFGAAIGIASERAVHAAHTRRLAITAAPLARGMMLSGAYRLAP
jgi:membrane-associated phospholipid phosphatase